jgi:hypothetical protein
MIFTCLKITVFFLVPLGTLQYARVARWNNDARAIRLVTQSPLNESLQNARVEERYLHQLVIDLDH